VFLFRFLSDQFIQVPENKLYIFSVIIGQYAGNLLFFMTIKFKDFIP